MNASDSWITMVKGFSLVDLSTCSADKVGEIVRRVPDYITVQPRGSVLVLTDFSGAALSELKQRQLTSSSVGDPVTSGAISPDGRHLAYVDLLGVHVQLPGAFLPPTAGVWPFLGRSSMATCGWSRISKPATIL
jgi:hypothetical protein